MTQEGLIAGYEAWQRSPYFGLLGGFGGYWWNGFTGEKEIKPLAEVLKVLKKVQESALHWLYDHEGLYVQAEVRRGQFEPASFWRRQKLEAVQGVPSGEQPEPQDAAVRVNGAPRTRDPGTHIGLVVACLKGKHLPDHLVRPTHTVERVLEVWLDGTLPKTRLSTLASKGRALIRDDYSGECPCPRPPKLAEAIQKIEQQVEESVATDIDNW